MESGNSSARPGICLNCGKLLLASDRFCPYCGTSRQSQPRLNPAPPAHVPPGPSSRGYSSDILSGAAALVIGLLVFGTSSLWWPKPQTTNSSPTPPAPSVVAAQPGPAVVYTPAPRPSVRVWTLTDQERMQGQQELQPLLGNLYYPGAEIAPGFAARADHTFREGRAGGSPLYPSIALLAPVQDSLENVVAYYERVAPGGNRQPQGGYRVDHFPRPGDQVPVRVLVVRPDKGPSAGRIVIMLMTFR